MPEQATPLALLVIHSPEESALGTWVTGAAGPRILGRHAGHVDVCFADSALSRKHVELIWSDEPNRITAQDLGSRNGVFVDGCRAEREHLVAGSLLRVGDTLLLCRTMDPAAVGWRPPSDSGMVGLSAALRSVVRQAEQVGATDMPVLVLGETGVGKELVARYIHHCSALKGRFVAVNCASFAPGLASSELFGHVKGAFTGAERAHEGLFLEASGGTLFLDEVGELDTKVQAQLLRAVEEGAVRPVGSVRPLEARPRLVAATNNDLDLARQQNRFREDLYARLAQWVIRVPPLRERQEDIPLLLRSIVQRHGHGKSWRFAGDLLEALVLAPWPQNIRELQGVVRTLLVRHAAGGLLDARALPEPWRSQPTTSQTDQASTDPELTHIDGDSPPTRSDLDRLLRHYGGSVAEVARHLGKRRMQVYRWMTRHGLDPATYRSGSSNPQS